MEVQACVPNRTGSLHQAMDSWIESRKGVHISPQNVKRVSVRVSKLANEIPWRRLIPIEIGSLYVNLDLLVLIQKFDHRTLYITDRAPEIFSDARAGQVNL